jgi:outer membrane protein TolC
VNSPVLAACTVALARPAAPPKPPAQGSTSTLVSAAPVERVDLTHEIVLFGSLRAEHTTLVRARVNGYLAEIPIEEGDLLEAGAPLARIAVPDLEADLAQAQADLARRAALADDARAGVLEAIAAQAVAAAAILQRRAGEQIAVAEREVIERELERLIEHALAARPELGAARADQRASEARARAAKIDWLVPSLSMQAAVGSMGDDLDDLERREVLSAALRWDLGAPLFGAAARARADNRAASLETERARRSTIHDVVSAWSASRSAAARILAAAEGVSVAEAALDLTLLRVEQGAGLLLEALEADLDLSRGRRTLVSAVGDFNRAQYALLRAVGGAD